MYSVIYKLYPNTLCKRARGARAPPPPPPPPPHSPQPPAPSPAPATVPVPVPHTAHLAPHAHPAHALLSVAHALLCPAGTIANPALSPRREPATLPIDDDLPLPCDVGDFSDVVDAINKLCDTMKTSHYECGETEMDSVNDSAFSLNEETVPCADATPDESNILTVQYEDATCSLESVSIYHEAESASFTSLERPNSRDNSLEEHRGGMSIGEEVALLSNELFTQEVPHRLLEAMYADVVSPEASFGAVEALNGGQNWSDSTVSLPVELVTSDVACEPASEMYYTASSEVSLLSDTEIPAVDRGAVDDDSLNGRESEERKQCVMAGHVAAMRERFESLTRAATPAPCPDAPAPCPDCSDMTPSPDRLG
ncbi:hypothetical protein ACJJTC_017491 [Scirpophaga incertulas]